MSATREANKKTRWESPLVLGKCEPHFAIRELTEDTYACPVCGGSGFALKDVPRGWVDGPIDQRITVNEKIAVMQLRYAAGNPLQHSGDCEMDRTFYSHNDRFAWSAGVNRGERDDDEDEDFE